MENGVRGGETEIMETTSQKERSKMAITKAGRSGFIIPPLDDYTSTELDDNNKRSDTQDNKRNAGGTRTGRSSRADNGGKGMVLESDRTGCKLVSGFQGGYACYHCDGGYDYDKCLEIRGIKK